MIICGYCKTGFQNDNAHNNHNCKVLGFKPTDPRIMGKFYKQIQEKAKERGKKKKK